MGWQWSADGILATPRVMHSSDRWKLLSGQYEKEERDLLGEFGRHDNIIELGSNIGVVARHALRHNLKDGGTLICVEANPLAQDALAKNLRAAARRFPRRTVEVVAAAVAGPGSDGETIRFVSRPNLTSGAADNMILHPDEKVTEVPARSLSGLLDQYAPQGRISLICDIEGAEIMVIKDKAAFERIDRIAMEFHGPEQTGRPETPQDVLASIVDMGYLPVKWTKGATCCLLMRDAA